MKKKQKKKIVGIAKNVVTELYFKWLLYLCMTEIVKLTYNSLYFIYYYILIQLKSTIYMVLMSINYGHTIVSKTYSNSNTYIISTK